MYRTSQFQIESVESRTLMSHWGILLRNKTLIIRGEGNTGNVIDVTIPDGKNILATDTPSGVLGVTGEFALPTVNRIRIIGGKGADRIQIGNTSASISFPSTITGGNGDDTIIASTGRDRIICGSGKDLLDGGGGEDNIFGGKGNDIVKYYAGDRVHLHPAHGEVIDADVISALDANQQFTPANVMPTYSVDQITLDDQTNDCRANANTNKGGPAPRSGRPEGALFVQQFAATVANEPTSRYQQSMATPAIKTHTRQ